MLNSREVFYITIPNNIYHQNLIEINHIDKTVVEYFNIDQRSFFISDTRNLEISEITYDLLINALKKDGYHFIEEKVNSIVPSKELIRKALLLKLSENELKNIVGVHGEIGSYYDYELIVHALNEYLLGNISIEYLKNWAAVYAYAIKDELSGIPFFCIDYIPILWKIGDTLSELSYISENIESKDNLRKIIDDFLDEFRDLNQRILLAKGIMKI